MYYIGVLGADCPSTDKNPHSLWSGQEKPQVLFYLLSVMAMEPAQVTSANAQPSTLMTNNILWSSPFLAPPDIWEAKKHCWHDCKEYNHFFFFLLFSNKQIDCCQHISFFIIGHFQWVCHCIFFHSAALLLRLVLDNLSAKIIMSTGIFLFQQGKKRQVNLLQEVHKLENIL